MYPFSKIAPRRVSVRLAVVAGAAALTTALGGPALAAGPGVEPATVDKSNNPGGSFTVDKTVTTPEIPPKPDIVLLVDTTGSMGSTIANVQANLNTAIASVRSVQPSAQFAVASYRDVGEPGLFTVKQQLTANTTDVQNAVNGLSAGGGGDTPEAWINALYEVSTGAITNRPGSSRIVVLVGDASSHDPSNGHTLADATNALTASGARVVAVNVVSGSGDGLDAAHQATAVVNATSGQLSSSNPGAVTNAVVAGLRNLDVTVTPEVVSCDSGLSVSFNKTDVTVQSGNTASYVETVNVANDATQGSALHCKVRFLIDGAPAGDAFNEDITVHVNDVTPPVVKVDDKTVEATSPAGAVIDYPATAVDNVDGPLTPTCVAPSGSTFALGDTVVTCSATDAAGNLGKDTAVMRVADTTPPKPACNAGPNPAGAVPSPDEDGFFKLTAEDIVDTSPEIFIQDSASTAKFGPYKSGVTIKLTQAPGATPEVKPGTGAVNWKIRVKGDAVIVAVDDFGNKANVTCLVPPPPK